MSKAPLSLPDFRLETYFSRWEFSAEHHLTASDVESMTISDLLAFGTDEQRSTFENLHLGYTPTWGLDDLRVAIAGGYEGVEPKEVLGFAGAGEALFWAMQVFVEAGDHVIVTVPNYQSIESIPLATGVEVSGLELWAGTGSDLRWTLDIDRFESLIKPTTKVVAVNFPNNPTGFVPDQNVWRDFNVLCHERGIRVVSDEVYRGVETNPGDTIPAAVEVNPSALTIGVMSKAYGLPGLRIGWIASHDRETLARLERAKHYTSVSSASPSEYLAVIALQNGRQILDRNRSIIAENDRMVAERFGAHEGLFDYETPVGGCVAFPRYLGPDGVERFCARAVEEHGVFLLPASVYRSDVGDVPNDRFRVGIGRADLSAGLDALDQFIQQQ